MFNGKRTYILMAMALVAAWGGYFTGGLSLSEAIAATFGALGGMTVRAGITNDVAKASGKVLALLVACAAFAGCALPSAEQGHAAQGSTVTAPPLAITFNIGTGGGITTTNTSLPTAAPSAASTAQAEQHATTDVKADAALGDSAIKAVTPLLGGTSAAVDAVAPKVKPKAPVVETPPTPIPAPVPPAPPTEHP